MNVTQEMLDEVGDKIRHYTELMDTAYSNELVVQDAYGAYTALQKSYEHILMLEAAVVAQKTASYFTRDLGWED